MTITLEESYIEEISSIASETGKTKTKVVREALQTYTPANLHPSETYTPVYESSLLWDIHDIF